MQCFVGELRTGARWIAGKGSVDVEKPTPASNAPVDPEVGPSTNCSVVVKSPTPLST